MATRSKSHRKAAPTANRQPRRPAPSPRGLSAQPPASDLLDMDQAIAMLKTTRPTFYRWLRGGKLAGMKVGRQWRFDRAEVERFLRGEPPRIELRADIDPLLDALRARLGQLGSEDPFPADMPALEHAVQLMLLLMVKMGATDVHIEPMQTREHGLAVLLRYRVDGVLHPVATFDPRLVGPVLEQWKTMATVDVLEKQKPQDAVIAISLPGVQDTVVLRVTFLPAHLGESLTIRMAGTLSQAAPAFAVDRLGLAPADRDRLLQALRRPWGVVLICGPSGSGTRTTLYSCLMHLASPDRKILSIEDPVQYPLPGLTQVPVRADAGATYAVLMRAAMRSAPNVIAMGETRDREALNLLLQAALTGHLVFSRLHTNDAASALVRLRDMGGDPQVIGDAARLVVAQRLVRTLCPHCSQPDPAPQFLERAADLARGGGLDWDALPKQFRRPVGCPRCYQTGYAGRTIIAETLQVTPEIVALLRQGDSAEQIRAAAIRSGMTTFAADAVRRAAEGQTTLGEVNWVAGSAVFI